MGKLSGEELHVNANLIGRRSRRSAQLPTILQLTSSIEMVVLSINTISITICCCLTLFAEVKNDCSQNQLHLVACFIF